MGGKEPQFPKDRDAYGHIVMDHLKGLESYEIIEREDGYVDGSMDSGHYFADYPDWPPYEQEAMRFLRPGRILDLGSGAGRMELYLQMQGFEIVGIDNSPLAVEVCRQRGAKDVRLVPVTKINRKLGVFDNVLMMGNNWGLLANPHRAKWLLRRLHGMTTANARIIAESNDIYRTDNPFHLAYQAYNKARGRMAGQIRFRLLYEMSRSEWFDYLMVSPDEMRSILQGTGWKVSRLIQSDGSVYVAVIEKGE